MMTDILGRVINVGDLVVTKATGRHSSGLNIGIWNGSSVRFKGGKKASYTQYFLVENPTGKELEHKELILAEVKAEEDLKIEKAKKPGIKPSELVRGKAYKDVNGNIFYYIGKVEYEYTDTRYPRNSEQKSGYGYISDWCAEYYKDINEQICIRPYIRKTPMKLCEELDKEITLDQDKYEYVRTLNDRWNNGRQQRAIVKFI